MLQRVKLKTFLNLLRTGTLTLYLQTEIPMLWRLVPFIQNFFQIPRNSIIPKILRTCFIAPEFLPVTVDLDDLEIISE